MTSHVSRWSSARYGQTGCQILSGELLGSDPKFQRMQHLQSGSSGYTRYAGTLAGLVGTKVHSSYVLGKPDPQPTTITPGHRRKPFARAHGEVIQAGWQAGNFIRSTATQPKLDFATRLPFRPPLSTATRLDFRASRPEAHRLVQLFRTTLTTRARPIAQGAHGQRPLPTTNTRAPTPATTPQHRARLLIACRASSLSNLGCTHLPIMMGWFSSSAGSALDEQISRATSSSL